MSAFCGVLFPSFTSGTEHKVAVQIAVFADKCGVVGVGILIPHWADSDGSCVAVLITVGPAADLYGVMTTLQ